MSLTFGMQEEINCILMETVNNANTNQSLMLICRQHDGMLYSRIPSLPKFPMELRRSMCMLFFLFVRDFTYSSPFLYFLLFEKKKKRKKAISTGNLGREGYMKIKIICKDGVEQTQHINPKNLEKIKLKYKKERSKVPDLLQERNYK